MCSASRRSRLGTGLLPPIAVLQKAERELAKAAKLVAAAEERVALPLPQQKMLQTVMLMVVVAKGYHRTT